MRNAGDGIFVAGACTSSILYFLYRVQRGGPVDEDNIAILRSVALNENQLESLLRLLLNDYLRDFQTSFEEIESCLPERISSALAIAYEWAIKMKSAIPLYSYFVTRKHLVSDEKFSHYFTAADVGIDLNGTVALKFNSTDIKIGTYRIGPIDHTSVAEVLRITEHFLKSISESGGTVSVCAEKDASEEIQKSIQNMLKRYDIGWEMLRKTSNVLRKTAE